jgi:hypothetical protein
MRKNALECSPQLGSRQMHLHQWLSAEGKNPSNFAREIGVPASTIRRIIVENRSGTHAVTEKIIRGTGGKVLPNDFFDIDQILKAK